MRGAIHINVIIEHMHLKIKEVFSPPEGRGCDNDLHCLHGQLEVKLGTDSLPTDLAT